MKVLVACEFSGTVRDSFLALGHEAVSCDLLPNPSKHHYTGDIRDLIGKAGEWDLMVAFPPCTHLSASGARWFAGKAKEQAEAVQFVRDLLNAPIARIALENPVGVLSSRIRPPDQIIQPWMFGHEHTKTTCLWLKNLPKLKPVKIVGKGRRHVTKSGRSLPEWYNIPPSRDRWKKRSLTFQGVADAMANQWGAFTYLQPEQTCFLFD
jgi:site-specific DNA-cytosine methylase